MDLETLLTSPEGLGIETASLLQRAICRIVDGTPLDDLLARATETERQAVEAMVGAPLSQLPEVAPVETVLLAPVRTFKTLFAVACATKASQSVDVSPVRPGQEPPRFSVLATQLDTARTFRGHLEAIKQSPILRRVVVGETADSMTLRHPHGPEIEIKCVAAHRGGYSLHSRWSAGVTFSEAPGWHSTDKVVSLEENRDTALGRLLPGASILYEGSPWQPSGWIFDAVRRYHGHPSADILVLWPRVIDGRTPAEWLNPGYWTPERVARTKRTSPRTYTMHLCNEFGGAAGVFDMDAVVRAQEMPKPLDYDAPAPVCIIDPSSGKKDSWTWCFCNWVNPVPPDDAFEWEPLVDHKGHIITRRGEIKRDERGYPVLRADYKGPVRPFLAFWGFGSFDGDFWKQRLGSDVVEHIAEQCHRVGATAVHSDQREAYMLQSEFKRHGLKFTEHPYSMQSKPEAVARVRRWLRDGTIQLPKHDILHRELLNFSEVPTAGGGFTFKARGSGHDDFVCLLLTAALADIEGQLRKSPIGRPRHASMSLEELRRRQDLMV